MVKTKKTANITTTTTTTTTPAETATNQDQSATNNVETATTAATATSPTTGQPAAAATPQVAAPPKENSEENVVYVFNSKKTEHIPSLSSECLALETSLRFKKINYKYATPDKCVDKPHGEPTILLNQKEYVGLDKIEEALANFVLEQHGEQAVIFPELTADQQADCQAYIYALADMVLYQVLNVQRFKHTTSTVADLAIVKRFKSGFQRLFRPNKDEDRLTKMTPEKLSEIVKDGLNALNNYFTRGGADKTYFFGDKPTKHDAVLFGLLAQYWQEPPTSNGGSCTDFSLARLLESIPEENNKIVAYLQNIKDTYWPDWTDRCAKPAPPPTATPSKRATFRKSKSEQQHAVSATVAAAATPAEVVNGTATDATAKVTNGTDQQNGDAKDTEKKELENGNNTTTEKITSTKTATITIDVIKKIDDEPTMVPIVEIKAE